MADQILRQKSPGLDVFCCCSGVGFGHQFDGYFPGVSAKARRTSKIK